MSPGALAEPTAEPAKRLPRHATMVQALQERDSRFAKRFIVAVRTTKIYCVPGCPAPPPKPKNVDFVASPAEARKLGCRACKRCHPDQAFYGLHPDEPMYESLVKAVFDSPEDFEGVEHMAKRAAIGLSRLHQGFRQFFHRTPLELLNQARVEKAALLLLSDKVQAGEVGLRVGFASSSVFYTQFGRLMGMTPAAYGRLRHDTEFQIELPPGFDIQTFRAYLLRDPHDPLIKIVDDRLQMRLQSRGLFEFSVTASAIHVSVERSGDAPAAHARVARIAGLNLDPPTADELNSFSSLASGCPGLRVFQSADFFDAVVWSIVGQQLTLGFAMKLRQRLYNLLRSGPHPYAPITPAEIKSIAPAALIESQFSSRKVEYLIAAADRLEGISPEEFRYWPYSKISRFFLETWGFGPWSTNYVLMRGLGFGDCVPIGDSGLATALQRHYGLAIRPGPKEQEELMTKFQPYRSLATFHLWHSLKVIA